MLRNSRNITFWRLFAENDHIYEKRLILCFFHGIILLKHFHLITQLLTKECLSKKNITCISEC